VLVDRPGSRQVLGRAAGLSTVGSVNDDQIHETITELVDREHQLRAQSTHTDEQRSELAALEQSLDQCWDLLRQRAALRQAGADPDAAHARPVSEVEGYLQ
jgi:Protein of unknown function (DUF2630)